MAATTMRLLHLRPILRPHPYPLRHFSSSSDPPQTEPEPESTSQTETQTQSSFSSYLNDVKASLQREPPPPNRIRRPILSHSSRPPPSPSKLASLDEIRRNLAEYRLRSAAPPPRSGQYISFQELYKRNVISKSDESTASPSVKPPSFGAAAPSEKNKIDFGGKSVDSALLDRFTKSWEVKSDQDSPMVIGGSDGDGLPPFIFGKEKVGSEEDSGGAMRTAFFKSYSYSELGLKLQVLRPEKKKRNWFSLPELNDRLARLREIEEKESQGKIGGSTFKHLRESLVKLRLSQDEAKREKTKQRLDVLGQLGGAPSFMLSPPKEHLVEKYFHPDNMSSAEKLKLELKRVRDEFKMSESDCGSARVQVAQLTTKIKHLSTVLQKKDKHSRKGLQAMVQRRKKLLKYLRRTDWDSYCLVLSKLGLRDNPVIKA